MPSWTGGCPASTPRSASTSTAAPTPARGSRSPTSGSRGRSWTAARASRCTWAGRSARTRRSAGNCAASRSPPTGWPTTSSGFCATTLPAGPMASSSPPGPAAPTKGSCNERRRRRTSGAVLLPVLRGHRPAAGCPRGRLVALRQLRAGVPAEVHRRGARRSGFAMSQVLLAVAHGSRDPAAQQCVLSLTSRVARSADGVTVRTAFVQLAQPSLADGLDDAATLAGADGVVVVPLLLSSGYHLSSDIAGAARAVGVPVARPLGPDARLVRALSDRLREAGVPGQVPVVLAAAGSSDPRALADTRRQAAMLAAHRHAPVVAAFATAARPTVDEAVSFLADVTGGPVAVAAYLLAPGLFHHRLWDSSGTWVSGPIGDHPAVAELILDRFRETAGAAGAARSLCVAGTGRWMADWTGGACGDRRQSA